MNVTNALQTGLIGMNRGLDNNPRAAGDFHGSGKAEIPETASGAQRDEAVEQSTLSAGVEAASTKIVSGVSETLGANVDVVV